MIQSMTGYGAAEHVDDGVSYAMEVRSVNHRYLKIMVRLPEPWQYAENTVEKVLRGRLSRGSVTCALRVRLEGDGGLCPINLAAMQGYVDQLARVRLPDHLRATIDLGAAAQLPGVAQTVEFDDETRGRRQEVIERLTTRAVDAMIAMRRDEGVALRQAVVDSCMVIRERLTVVGERAPRVIEEYHERLRNRVAKLMREGGFELEADALAREVALYAERCDISEELIRLTSHLDQFLELCDRDDPVGRTLDFLAQELLREANTIASKSNDALITRHVVEIKGLIDRVKEQVQNVE